MYFGTETSGLDSEGGLNFGWSLLRNFAVLEILLENIHIVDKSMHYF